MTRARKVLLSVGLVVGLLAGALVVLPPLLFSDGVDYSKAVSIKTAREYQDPTMLERAWALPVAQRYMPGVDFQSSPSFCGPTSVVNVMRSLGRPADQKTVLDETGTSTFLGNVVGGLTLDELAEIARTKVGGKVTVMREMGLAEFRAQLGRANDPAVRLILNFHRGPLFGKGGGHHSPIAGFLVDQDLVLVLDVNEKFQPWLVRSERLYEAMNTLDKGAGKKRGLLVIEPAL